MRRVFSPARRLTFSIADMRPLSPEDYLFLVKVTDDSSVYDVEIRGKEQLEKLWKIMSEKSVILGLEDMVETFRRAGEGSFAQVFQAVTTYKAKMALKCF